MNKLFLAISILCSTVISGADAADANDRVEALLNRLAADYDKDPNRLNMVFGIRVGARDWTIDSTTDPATVSEGQPDEAAMIFVTDEKTFTRIASGDMNALTSLAQAGSSDPTPMTMDFVNGFEFDDKARAMFMSLLFHFFATGQPEIVPLGSEHSRFVHGGNALPIYYAPQLRTSWYGIGPGQHINEDPKDQVNDFPSIFIIMKAGSAKARFGGKEIDLEDNTAIFVPAGMAHELWNDGEEEAQFILLMFGENA